MRIEGVRSDFGSMDEVIRVTKEFNGASVVQNSPVNHGKEQAQEQVIAKEELESRVDQLNKAMEVFNRKFRFEVHEETKRVIVQVLNSETGEVVSEIPPKKVLDMVANMEKAFGLIIDERV